MKKFKTAFLSTFLTTALMMLFSISAYAAQASVSIEPNAVNVPQDLVQELAAEYPDAHITITGYKEADPAITPRIWWFDLTEKKTTQSDVEAKDSFVISVARGGTKTLSKTWTGSLSPTCSYKNAQNSLSLNATITRTYSKTEKFEGPSNSSSYNSREFRVKFYEDRGTFKGQYVSDAGDSQQKSGTWKSPTKFLEYSVDRNV
ncbi:MAG: hypothetical protein LBQ71_01430 [Hungatella sp.]|jgi:hypothetical protein|nr:hypothetical protein [Hungatella sp.]